MMLGKMAVNRLAENCNVGSFAFVYLSSELSSISFVNLRDDCIEARVGTLAFKVTCFR